MGIRSLKITVYTRSLRVPTGETLVEEPYPVKPRNPRAYEISRDLWFKVKVKKTYSYVLPEDQRALVEFVKNFCERRGFELKVIDVTRETALQRLRIRLRRIRNFPTVETSQGARIQAPFTEKELERFISKSAVHRD